MQQSRYNFVSTLTRSEDLLPNISIDCVILGFYQRQLKVLLLKYNGSNLHSLPGGFIRKNEDLEEAALRVLEERTGLSDIYLEQFATFGGKNRQFASTQRIIFENNGYSVSENHFLLNRFVSVGYYALIDFSKANPSPDELSESCNWYDLNMLPTMAFDHSDIVKKALNSLRSTLDFKLIGFNLLPETFTMNELQALYETILDEKMVRSNFQRKMLNLGILERIEKKMTGAPNKAPYLYRLIKK